MTLCSIDECDKPVRARSWCGMHYMRWFTTGSTDAKVHAFECAFCLAPFERSGQPGNYGTSKFQVVVNKYNLTIDRYRELVSAGCAICATKEDLVIDHDHACCSDKCRSCGECVRGMLCGDCNRAIGMLKENSDLLRRAAEYVATAA